MKTSQSIGLLAIALIAGATYSPTRLLGSHIRSQTTVSIFGVIMDSKCAISGSHDPIMKQLAAKGARDCTLKCARNGSFVLYNFDTQTVYQLDDQQKPMRFAGQKVIVSGAYEEFSQTIEVDTIEPAQ